MTGLSNQDLFNSLNSFASDEIDYHVITTDHPYMAELGLSAFTISYFYQWMTWTLSNGQFFNLKFIDGLNYSRLGNNESLNERFLGTNKPGNFIRAPLCNEENNFWFSRWEKRARTGQFIRNRWHEWSYYDLYKFDDLEFNTFTNKEIVFLNIGGRYDQNYDIQIRDKSQPDDTISTFITLNDLSRYIPLLSGFRSNALPRAWYAAHEFIMDIKHSKEKCIQWSVNIPFVAWAGTNRCVKTECVNFKLHLFDFTNPKNPNRPAALNANNLFISLPRQDAFGRYSLNDGTGNSASPDPNNPNATNVAGQLAMSVNPADGKVYSGSPTVLVKLTSDLPGAQWPSVKDNDDLETWLNPENAHAPGYGFCMPLSEQSANPVQWSPQYEKSGSCNVDNKKFIIPLQNHHPNKYPSGAIGYATKIMGQTFWSFIPAGTYDIPEISVDSRPKNWSFTYLMMNYDNFFTARPRTDTPGVIGYDRVTYTNVGYEEEVYRLYYNIPPINIANVSSRRILDNFPALQITSWDFMGTDIGGLRYNENNNSLGNALAVTVYGIDNNGQEWPSDARDYGDTSTPFFGCVFPDGYTTDKYDEYTGFSTRNLLIKPINDPGSRLQRPFFLPVLATGVIFQNKDDSTNRRLDKIGMFGGLSTLNHLPADIALNAAPNNDTQGSPLVNYYSLYNAFRADANTSSTSYQQKINNIIGSGYNNKNTWMYRDPNIQDSAFNFNPINSYKIQFRPLKHEIYDSFYPLNNNLQAIFSKNAASRQLSNLQPLNTVNAINRSLWLTSMESAGEKALIQHGNNSYSLRYNNTLLTSRFLPQNSWTAGIFTNYNTDKVGFLTDNIGTGAFGVIGSSCVVNLIKSITFDTSFKIGMRSYPTSGGRWQTAYGNVAKDNSYKSINNTQLYVRIYQHWPKEYTIYDPAHFAIFHFNTEDSSLDTTEYVYDSVFNVGLENNELIYSNTVGNYDQHILKERKSTARRKKLLPYKYILSHTIGIDLSSVYIRGSIFNYTSPPLPQHYSVVIDQQGVEYTSNDTFKVTGGNGVSPVLLANVFEGKIVGFRYQSNTDKGYNYKQSNFLNKTDDFLVKTGGLKIVPITVQGKGFQGRVVRGVGTTSPQLIDAKPEIIGSNIIQLTENTPIDGETTTPTDELTGSKKVTVVIESAKASKNGLYDLFFHFHNDTSHTLIDDYGMSQLPLEQFVELQIIPN